MPDGDMADRRVDRIVEVFGGQRFLEQPVLGQLALEPGAQLDERDMNTYRVELHVQLAQHVRRGDVDVGDRLALQYDPLSAVLAGEARNLLAEDAAVGEEEWRLPAEHGNARQPGGLVVAADRVPGSSGSAA